MALLSDPEPRTINGDPKHLLRGGGRLKFAVYLSSRRHAMMACEK